MYVNVKCIYSSVHLPCNRTGDVFIIRIYMCIIKHMSEDG